MTMEVSDKRYYALLRANIMLCSDVKLYGNSILTNSENNKLDKLTSSISEQSTSQSWFAISRTLHGLRIAGDINVQTDDLLVSRTLVDNIKTNHSSLVAIQSWIKAWMNNHKFRYLGKHPFMYIATDVQQSRYPYAEISQNYIIKRGIRRQKHFKSSSGQLGTYIF
jgi:hypothetical protein